MAEAKNDFTPPAGEGWTLLDDYFEAKRVEVDSSELAERLMREELNQRKLHFRFLDRNGHLQYDRRFTDRFWRGAKREASALSWDPPPVYYEQHGPTQSELGIVAEAAIRIYRVEVLVPLSDTAATEKPKTEIEADRTKHEAKPKTKTRAAVDPVRWQMKRIDLAAKVVYPDGKLPESAVDLRRDLDVYLAEENKNLGKQTPSEDTCRRWLKHRKKLPEH